MQPNWQKSEGRWRECRCQGVHSLGRREQQSRWVLVSGESEHTRRDLRLPSIGSIVSKTVAKRARDTIKIQEQPHGSNDIDISGWNETERAASEIAGSGARTKRSNIAGEVESVTAWCSIAEGEAIVR